MNYKDIEESIKLLTQEQRKLLARLINDSNKLHSKHRVIEEEDKVYRIKIRVICSLCGHIEEAERISAFKQDTICHVSSCGMCRDNLRKLGIEEVITKLINLVTPKPHIVKYRTFEVKRSSSVNNVPSDTEIERVVDEILQEGVYEDDEMF